MLTGNKMMAFKLSWHTQLFMILLAVSQVHDHVLQRKFEAEIGHRVTRNWSIINMNSCVEK